MTCRECAGGTNPVRVAAFAYGDTRASIRADRAADAERSRNAGPVHVHFDLAEDALVVVRTDPNHEAVAA
ncbi:hypothetical protein [Streptomyces sp. NPDC003077]|uniref:hypothetical protein n=1 Tax=Streptomyces sp. NPDC003077 TaxID=3154443 RepID=UPI0033A45FC9